MRKRKLYLSEFIKRYKLKFDTEIKIYYGNACYNYNNMSEALEDFKGNEEIETWSYNEYFGYIIVIVTGRK